MYSSKIMAMAEYSFDECEKEIAKELRERNIKSFIEQIRKDVEKNNLNTSNEKYIILYETEAGEKVGIAYPGKESDEKRKNCFPYDMRPVLYTKDGRLIKNQNFYDLYNIIENLYINSPNKLFPCFISVIFRMGYLIDCKLEKLRYYNYYNEEEDGNIEFYNYNFNSDLVKRLNSYYEEVETQDSNGNTTSISFLSYLMYYFLLFQQEDNKYYYRNGNKVLDQGRTSTALSSILFGGVLQGRIPVSNALQKFIEGKGIGRCQLKDISSYTNGLILYTQLKKEIFDLCREKNIKVQRNATVTIDKNKIKVVKIPDLNIIMIKKEDEIFIEKIMQKGWKKYFKLNCKEDYIELLNIIKNKTER